MCICDWDRWPMVKTTDPLPWSWTVRNLDLPLVRVPVRPKLKLPPTPTKNWITLPFSSYLIYLAFFFYNHSFFLLLLIFILRVEPRGSLFTLSFFLSPYFFHVTFLFFFFYYSISCSDLIKLIKNIVKDNQQNELYY